MKHLHESIVHLLELSNKERIDRIRNDHWIGYSRAKHITDKLEDLLTYPKKLRMPNLLIVGDTNNGKTLLVHRFFTKHKPQITEADNKFSADVIYMQAPTKPEEKRFYNSLLDVLCIPYRANDRVETKQRQVISLLRTIGAKMLIIDEIHHVLAGNIAAQRIFLNTIKYLSNELQIVIVCVGIIDAFNVMNSDPQLANRFEPAVLPKWHMNEEYLRLLASFEYTLPLKHQSDLTNEVLALKILSMSEGTIGEISTILKAAAVSVIKDGSESITKNTLDNLDYTSPSERKRRHELLR
ncbi:MAG: TniB family NTP-binding protein [Bacteroidia bacterium]